MIIVGVLLIVAGAAFGIDVAVKNRFPVSDLEVFGSTLGFHHAEQIFLLGAVTGAVILLGLVLLTAGTVRRRSRNGAYRRHARGLAENDQRAVDRDPNQRPRPMVEDHSRTSGEARVGVDSTEGSAGESRLSPAVGGSTALDQGV